MLLLHGDFQRQLEPFRVTPLQAGVLVYLQRHRGAMMKEAAAAVNVTSPTLTVVIDRLVRKRWVISHRASHDDRAVLLRLTSQGQRLVRKITKYL